MSDELPASKESTANELLANLVGAWNKSSFENYSAHFTGTLVDHYNPSYFTRIREQSGAWLANQYLGCLRQGAFYVHLWRARFEKSANDVLFSLTLTADGQIAGLLKRAGGV